MPKAESPTWQILLTSSNDPELLCKTAISICDAGKHEDITTLISLLRDPAFLARLDPEIKGSLKTRTSPNTQKVVVSVGKIKGKFGEEALLELSACDAFMSDYYRVNGLLYATWSRTEPSTKLLDMVDNQIKQNKCQLYVGIQAFGHMASEAACKRIEYWFKSPPPNDEPSTAWFNELLIDSRYAPPVVALYKRLLETDIKENYLRNIMIQSLFDNRQADWFPPSLRRKDPPSPREASTEVLLSLKDIAAHCLKLNITPTTEKGIKDAQKHIDAILEFRRSGQPERIAKLIVQLDDNSHATREKATAELEKYADWAEPALKAALEKSPGPEARQRITGILAKLKQKSKS